MASLKKAFHEVCSSAEARGESHFVSLYKSVPRYGGPEEGGWWTTDVVLVASQEFTTRAAASRALVEVERLAATRSASAKDAYGEQCSRELADADRRGIEYDELREVDGETTFTAVVEDRSGELEEQGDTHYE